ncbi:MAG: Hpt domain-containing protein [Achromobacter sp.]
MIAHITAADPVRMQALASAFVHANEQDLRQLRTLHTNEDLSALRQLAHRIKGAAQMTGDVQLSALCSELEQISLDPAVDAQALGACIACIEFALEEFGESCRRIAQGLQSG